MISRLKPTLGFREFIAALRLSRKDDVERFEQKFARLMGQRYALAFPYGRTGLILLLESLGLKDKEIICPAYTCVVVPHAIVYSGNTPIFVDCTPGEFNMNLDHAERAITDNTGAIIATSLFGYPVNLDRLDELQEKYPHIPIIQDCAHSFAAEWKGRSVQKEGIAALFGLNISKTLTSIFGGMITTDHEDVYANLKTLRDQKLKKPDWRKGLRRLLYLLAGYPTFWEPVYGLVNRLERSGILDYFTQYYDESEIDMPSDYLQKMSPVEARVGIVNISCYERIIDNRRAAARYYFSRLNDRPSFKLPQQVPGATYSHFVVQVEDRNKWVQKGLSNGIQLGRLIEYSIPEMKTYGGYHSIDFPVAGKYARTVINLPAWGGEKMAAKVVGKIGRD